MGKYVSKMRLELKILAILFLLVGIYAGVMLLPESQTDEKERVPEGLVLADLPPTGPSSEENVWPPLTSTQEKWVESGWDGKWKELRCPHGYDDPGREDRMADLADFGADNRPNNFLQKHFCPWCTDEVGRQRLDDALAFSRRRWDGSLDINTVIIGGPKEEAEWEAIRSEDYPYL